MRSPTRNNHLALVLIFSLLTVCGAGPPINHIIKFFGLKHGYNNQQEAIGNLLNNLKKITGSNNITIDQMDPDLTTWHSDDVSVMPDCPELEIKVLLAKIKSPRVNDYTRQFKMDMGENFVKPDSVEFEWIGPCGSRSQKRNEISGFSEFNAKKDATIAVVSSTPEPTAPTTTTEMSISPVESMTTTDSPSTTTMIGLDVSSSSSSTDQLNSTGGYSLISDSSELDNETDPTLLNNTNSSPDFGDGLNFTSISLTLPTIPAVNLTDIAFTTSAQPITTTTPTTTTTKTPTTTSSATIVSATANENLLFVDTSSTVVTSPEEMTNKDSGIISTTTSLLPSDDGTTKSPIMSEAELKAIKEDEKPHYGKYIGLTMAFLIFVAYLVCTRALRKQGMYELAQTTE